MAMKTGYASGAYDLFHVGHLNLLRRARSQCDYLIAGVLDDQLVELTTGERPMIPIAERLEIVGSIRFVDEARVELSLDKLEMWRELGFDIYFRGTDGKGTPDGMALERRFAEVGVRVTYFPYSTQTSSTLLRRGLSTLARRPTEAENPFGGT